LRPDVFAEDFLLAVFLLATFLVAVFFAEDFLVEDFLVAAFLVDFFTADFFVAFLVAMWVEPPVTFERMGPNFVASGTAWFAQNDVQGYEQADAERYVEYSAVRPVEISVAPGGVGEVEVCSKAGDGDGIEGSRGIGAGSDG
jgi:hypothetical protein